MIKEKLSNKEMNEKFSSGKLFQQIPIHFSLIISDDLSFLTKWSKTVAITNLIGKSC